MRDRECWDTFYMSGKVADYLSYREAAENAADRTQSEEDASGRSWHAGFCGSNRDSLKGCPCFGDGQKNNGSDKGTGEDIGFCQRRQKAGQQIYGCHESVLLRYVPAL